MLGSYGRSGSGHANALGTVFFESRDTGNVESRDKGRSSTKGALLLVVCNDAEPLFRMSPSNADET